MQGTAKRGTSVVPPGFWGSRSDLMWTPPPRRIELSERDERMATDLRARFGDSVKQTEHTSDMLTFEVGQKPIQRRSAFS